MTLDGVVRVLGLAAMLGGLSGFVPLPVDGKILFPRGTAVPPAVQAFAWQVIETHCAYQGYERAQRSFWATRADATTVQGSPAYALRILSERSWQKTEPTASIEMTIVDDGGMRLAALRSTFIICEL
jgi:hypothetical protein